MRKAIVLFLMALWAFPVFSVEIQGKASRYPGKIIRLLSYTDWFTLGELELDRDTIDETGNFSLSTELEETSYGILEIENTSASLYLSPGQKYLVNFPDIPEDQIRASVNKIALEFLELPQSDINYKLTLFNLRYDRFFIENQEAIKNSLRSGGSAYKRYYKELKQDSLEKDSLKERPRVNTLELASAKFKKELDSLLENNQDPFFENYLRYAYASLEMTLRANKAYLFKKYIEDQAVLSGHPEYVSFISSYYQKYLAQRVMHKNREEMARNIINADKSYEDLMSFMTDSSRLYETELKELVMITGFYDLFYQSRFSQEALLDILRSVIIKSPYAENKIIARNLIAFFTQLEKGSEVPEFELLNAEGETVRLSDFRGKHVYLSFFETWSESCITQLNAMVPLHKKYSKDIVFLSISTDESPEEMKKIVKKNRKLKWEFLHYGEDKSVKSKFKAVTLPHYVLISPNGKILESPALGPLPNGTGKSIDYNLHYIRVKLHPVGHTGGNAGHSY